MSKKNDFDVMSQMSTEDQNIRFSNILVGTKQVSQGGIIEIGIDRKCFMDVTMNTDDYYIGLYIVDKKQFDKIKES